VEVSLTACVEAATCYRPASWTKGVRSLCPSGAKERDPLARLIVCRVAFLHAHRVRRVAVIVCGSIGLDTSGESIPYITGWGEQDLDAIKRHAAKVDEIARTLENVCEVS
jgi:hypothetical protein